MSMAFRRPMVGEEQATPVKEVRSARATVGAATLNTSTPVKLADLNPLRKGFSIFNNHATAKVYVYCGESGANVTKAGPFSFVMSANFPYWESPFNFCGEIWAIVDSAPSVGEAVLTTEFV